MAAAPGRISFTPTNDGNQAWKVTGPATTEARIRVVSINNQDVFDISDANFTIALPTITVAPDSPNGGENWSDWHTPDYHLDIGWCHWPSQD